jgi:hypothetical protein
MRRFLALGAGVQSTTLYLLACEAKLLPRVDGAIFADTQWEPAHVMAHLANLRRFGEEHGIPVYLASKGSLPDDVLNPQVFATIPAWTRGSVVESVPVKWGACPTCDESSPLTTFGDEVCADCDNQRLVPVEWAKRITKNPLGRVKRQCTPKYKIDVINQQVRLLLGASEWFEPCRYCDATGERVAPWEPDRGMHPCSICRGTGSRRRVGSVPSGAVAEQWIGFSTDELDRVTTAGFPSYEKPRHPLIELGWTRDDCEAFLGERGWQAEKSACIGCPFHDDDVWIDMKRRDPEDFARAVAFDSNPAFRNGSGMNAERFLHDSRKPLAEAVEEAERRAGAQGDQLLLYGQKKRPPRRGCSPYGCRSGRDGEQWTDDTVEGGT